MPELPEVETFRRNLSQGNNGSPSVIGKVIHNADVLWDGVLVMPSVDEFLHRVPGQTVVGVGRRGKYLLLHLSQDTLILHPRMSGEVILEKQDKKLGKHYRLLLNFQDGTRFAFNNVRKFGRVWLTETLDLVLSDLGPEPLSDDFTPEQLFNILQACHRQMKYVLLDQHLIAGLGNIYTDEALYLAHIHPRTKSDSLSFSEVEILWKSIRKVLKQGIENQGTSIDWIYKGGDYQKLLQVYKQDGDPCPRCGTTIQKITIAQRGTHYCPSCQPAPK
jgi:formamidopyrimidine-DNA glycosylase